MAQISIRYWAGARAAAGTPEDHVEVTEAVSLADLIDHVIALHPDRPRLPATLQACSTLVGDRPSSAQPAAEVMVAPGESVEFLPPFAGG
jgi:molybdopterin converting factor small subunit